MSLEYDSYQSQENKGNRLDAMKEEEGVRGEIEMEVAIVRKATMIEIE